MLGQKERPLELSDFASELHREILADPYKFLGLPDTASIADVRQTYINLSRRYHPDMIKPRFDNPDLFTDPALKTILAEWWKISLENTPQKIEEILASANSQDPQEQERRSLALKAIQTAAHEKMVRINIAYEAIKNRVDPKRWNSPLGYKHVQQYNPAEKDFEQEIKLEANAELTLYPNAYEYWMPGAYLGYDWGPIPYHEWYDEEIFRECTVVTHLFVSKELSEDRERISPVLLDPFFKNFELNQQQRETFTRLLLERKDSKEIMEALGINGEKEFHFGDYSDLKKRDRWLYAMKFRRHVNEMLTLSTEPSWGYRPIEMRWEDGKMVLKNYTETIFSEADVMLLSTLAYGPMLSSG